MNTPTATPLSRIDCYIVNTYGRTDSYLPAQIVKETSTQTTVITEKGTTLIVMAGTDSRKYRHHKVRGKDFPTTHADFAVEEVQKNISRMEALTDRRIKFNAAKKTIESFLACKCNALAQFCGNDAELGIAEEMAELVNRFYGFPEPTNTLSQ